MFRPLPIIALLAISCSGPTSQAGSSFPSAPDEPRLANLRMLTNGGENAEAYFSADDRRLIFQAKRPPGTQCDKIYVLDLGTGRETRVTRSGARTTCAYLFPNDEDQVVYSSTSALGDSCPTPPSMAHGYVWALYDYDIYTSRADGSNVRTLFASPGYDAEATISRDGSRIVFTSVRDGDLDIYTMDADGGNVRRLTDEPGYDGGAFFSADGSRIVYRAHHPTDEKELAGYRRLLKQGLVRPGKLEIYVMNADGSGKRRVTDLNAASFAPFFHPNGRQIIFSSNLADPRGRNFDLYLVNVDGSGLERITTHDQFDGFPMFSSDGRKLVFASNRGAAKPGDTNVFIADWVAP
ncbi:MAG: TolB family protein [Gemmatimonadota bacterium]